TQILAADPAISLTSPTAPTISNWSVSLAHWGSAANTSSAAFQLSAAVALQVPTQRLAQSLTSAASLKEMKVKIRGSPGSGSGSPSPSPSPSVTGGGGALLGPKSLSPPQAESRKIVQNTIRSF